MWFNIDVLFFLTGILVILNVEGKLYHKSNSDKGVILIYTSGLAFFNSLLDPIIYAFQISSVKKRFKSVFCCSKQNSVENQICTVGYTTNMVLIKSGVHIETINTWCSQECKWACLYKIYKKFETVF